MLTLLTRVLFRSRTILFSDVPSTETVPHYFRVFCTMSPGVLYISDEERSVVRLLTQNLSAFARAISATVPGMGLHPDVILWYEPVLPVLLGLILLQFYCHSTVPSTVWQYWRPLSLMI